MEIGRRVFATDRLTDLIDCDYNIIPLLSRFSIPLGFGDSTIREICVKAGIELNSFLLIINFIVSGEIDSEALRMVNPVDVAEFLRNSHDYFRNYKLPHIRKNLLNALDSSLEEINPSVLKFFDDYVSRVNVHFGYEEKNVFPYIRELMEGKRSRYNMNIFMRHHDDEPESILSDLKNVILRYYPTSLPNRMYDVLVDLYSFEVDLRSHTEIENRILIPMVAELEKRMKK